MKAVDAFSLACSGGVSLGHQDRLTAIQTQDSPIKKFMVQRTKGKALVQVVRSTEVEPTNMRRFNPNRRTLGMPVESAKCT